MKALWKGGIRFGLVYIPVKLYSGVTTHNVELDMLRHGDLCPIQYVRVCRHDGEEVEWKDIVKGYKMNEHYIALDSKDFEKARLAKSESLDIFRFVELDEVSPRYFKKTNLLEPEKGAAKTFNLLRLAMEETGLAGLCTYVMRDREKLGLLKAGEGHLYMIEMHWHQDLRELDEVKTPKATVSKEEQKMAVTLIGQMTGKFEPEKYKDEYKERLMKIIAQKSKGKKVTVKKQATLKITEEDDLLRDLKASLKALKAA